MKYIVAAVGILYALLCIYASATQLRNPKRRTATLLMLAGGGVLCLGVALDLHGWGPAWLVVLIGALLTCQAALLNGKANGRVNLHHHAVRFLITIFLILGSALW